MAINKEWHEKNRMPKNAKLSQRIEWHREHQKNCNCRPVPQKLLALVNTKNNAHKKAGLNKSTSTT